MGAPMAKNLASAGFAVRGFDPINPTIKGVTVCRAAQDALQNADIIITMLANGAILRQVAAELMPTLPDDTLWLDCSTVDVQSARDLADLGGGRAVLDAPVSGGISGAAAGTLTFMVGGEPAGFDRATPLFDIMGSKAVYCGDSGAGQAAKICNNMILGATMIATCEAFVLADKLGLDRQKMFDVVASASGASWSMNTYCPAQGVGPTSPADNDYRPGFAAELMVKDLLLAVEAGDLEAGDLARLELPMARRALEVYSDFVENGGGRGQDFSAMIRRLGG